MTVVRTVDIVNERGLHARASAKFVKLAAGFDAEVTVAKDGSRVDARSIMWDPLESTCRHASLSIL